MNATKGTIKNANVYQSSADEIRKGVQINRMAVTANLRSLSEKIVIDETNSGLSYRSLGHAIPPDEILAEVNPGNVKIPIKHRNEFPEETQLPSSELLQTLHYYFAHKTDDLSNASKLKFLTSLDETALIALGCIVEEWMEELLRDDSFKLYIENTADSAPRDSDSESDDGQSE